MNLKLNLFCQKYSWAGYNEAIKSIINNANISLEIKFPDKLFCFIICIKKINLI